MILTISNILLSFAGGMPAAVLFSTNTKPLLAAAFRICFAASGFEGDMSITGICADCLDILRSRIVDYSPEMDCWQGIQKIEG